MDTLTFGLAMLGYALLAANVVARRRGRSDHRLSALVAVVVLTHVALVWGHRFGWSLAYALDKSVAGFVVFHAALGLILATPFLREPWFARVLYLSFAIVTCGATGATFANEAVYGLRVPVIAVFVLTVGALLAPRGRGPTPP